MKIQLDSDMYLVSEGGSVNLSKKLTIEDKITGENKEIFKNLSFYSKIPHALVSFLEEYKINKSKVSTIEGLIKKYDECIEFIANLLKLNLGGIHEKAIEESLLEKKNEIKNKLSKAADVYINKNYKYMEKRLLTEIDKVVKEYTKGLEE